MSPQRQAEITFWRGEFERRGGEEGYRAARAKNLAEYATFLPEIYEERGVGLDLGCGLISVLEELQNVQEVHAVDPLLPLYNELTRGSSAVHYRTVENEKLPYEDASFDFVWCINVIDHTPEPKVMLAEARRVLRPGGRFYFLVNFDPELYAPHYCLWNMRTVEEMLTGFHLERGTLFWTATWKKYIWAALYRKP